MNRFLAGFADCKVVQCRAGFLVVLNRGGKVPVIRLFREIGQKGSQGRFHVTDQS